MLESRLHELRHHLLQAARHLAGAKVLAERLYGVGPVTALAMTCWLAGIDRFSSFRMDTVPVALALLPRAQQGQGAVLAGPSLPFACMTRLSHHRASVCTHEI